MEISPIREDSFYYYPIQNLSLQLRHSTENLQKRETLLDPEQHRPYYLPVSKMAKMEDAERVYWICHLCGRLVWTDTSKRITSGGTGEGTRITIEHTLCKVCKREYLGIEE
jgi:hypothetical protein